MLNPLCDVGNMLRCVYKGGNPSSERHAGQRSAGEAKAIPSWVGSRSDFRMQQRKLIIAVNLPYRPRPL